MNTKVLIKTAFRSSLFVRTGMLFLFLITFAAVSAQKKPLPEWQSQYAVGLNKLALIPTYGLTLMLLILKSRADTSNPHFI